MPPADLSGFPVRVYRKGTVLLRVHRAGRGPWWFASDMTGRFDLPPEIGGTCYLAREVCTALRESLGPRLAAAAAIPAAQLDGRVVSRLRLPAGVRAADTAASGAAGFGVTREISAATYYRRPQRWAAAFYESGFDAISYEGRFDPGRTAECVALFAAQPGQADLPVDPDPTPAAQVAAGCGIPVAAIPTRAALTVQQPPDGVR